MKPQCLIKRFTPSGETALARAADRDRFRQTVARLDSVSQHPQLPNLLGYFEQGDDQFLVQDYVVGEGLDQRLQAWGSLDGPAARQLLTQGLPLLHHLHSHQVIHRDIKPTNLLIPPQDSWWWLVDLGAAKPLTATQIAQPGTLIGSAEYAAPEQLRGEATYGSDLYNLGVVCLHALTGLNPFDLFDGSHGCWCWRSLVPDLAPALAEVLDAMVQPTLADRLPNAAAALQTLKASVSLPSPTPTTAAAPPPEPPTWQAAVTLTIDTPLLAATRGAIASGCSPLLGVYANSPSGTKLTAPRTAKRFRPPAAQLPPIPPRKFLLWAPARATLGSPLRQFPPPQIGKVPYSSIKVRSPTWPSTARIGCSALILKAALATGTGPAALAATIGS